LSPVVPSWMLRSAGCRLPAQSPSAGKKQDRQGPLGQRGVISRGRDCHGWLSEAGAVYFTYSMDDVCLLAELPRFIHRPATFRLRTALICSAATSQSAPWTPILQDDGISTYTYVRIRICISIYSYTCIDIYTSTML